MSLALKPTHATVKAYYETLHQYGQLHIDHEGAVRSAFQTLLAKCGQRSDPRLTLVPEYRIKRARGSSVIVDGALIDLYHLPHGYWEAKDEKDDLLKEVQHKLDKGYPSDNTIFQAPERAILYQGGTRIFDEDISRAEALVSVVNQFFAYKAPRIEEWLKAVDEFSERVPELSQQVENLIKEERQRNPAFLRVFQDFYELCRQSINPNLSEKAVEGMLVQHLLTERIFRRIFKHDEFRTRNVVAAEIEKVIVELTKRSLNRDDFLKRLEPFYHAIERNAENATGYAEKQDFLNTVYMRFFQGYSPKEADTHGIVYTPQPIVNFMVRSVEEILQKEFGRSLGDKGVHILDPFVGTGNFIVRIMQEIKATDLQYKYENELHCNEVMLLPYYIASMNIEHAYFDRMDEYKAFPGICMVDTFELAEPEQASLGFMTAENAERVRKQKESPIFVIVGNPPYNVGQINENDNNKNREYPHMNARVSETYARDSQAQSVSKLNDPYVKAFRWASDRLRDEGIVAFVSNNSFIEKFIFDGMRSHLSRDFKSVYLINLHGDIRKDSMRDGVPLGEEHTVFGLAAMVGVSISVLVRGGKGTPGIQYAEVNFRSTRKEKFAWLHTRSSIGGVEWKKLEPDTHNNWLTEGLRPEFLDFPQLSARDTDGIFRAHSLGVSTNRDAWACNFDPDVLRDNVRKSIEFYNTEVYRWGASDKSIPPDKFVRYDDSLISWSRDLKADLKRKKIASFDESKIRCSEYRPFTRQHIFLDRVFNEEVYAIPKFFPSVESEQNNIVICCGGYERKPFSVLACGLIPNLNFFGDPQQAFPFYTYAEDGTHRRENITDWALEQFRARYHDPSITKWDIFHYIYGVLHHPEYRERYAANLRRELPRIPFVSACHPEAAESLAKPRTPNEESVHSGGSVARASCIDPSAHKERGPQDDSVGKGGVGIDAGVFRAFVKAGERLADIHVHYEKQPEYPLAKKEKPGEKLDWRVTKMRLSKDKATLIYNQFLTLSGIPPETYEYRLGNRSALEWVIDQYQVSTDKRSGITNDPNRADDPQYILRLVGQVITVSLETVKVVGDLPPLGLPA